jgi:NAD(P)-dependent dehydrogenase (short-subunit alcohol dehydrogenase family)
MSSKMVIVGATGGVGSYLANLLQQRGHELHLLARDAQALSALASRLGASYQVVDVLDHASLQQALQNDVLQDGIQGLAYCVGSINLAPFSRVTAEQYTQAFTLNTVSAALCVQYALPGLRQAHGRVVLFSSVAARKGFTNHAIIGPVKAALEGLTVALAAELAPTIRVNCIAPSLSKTKMAAPLLKNEKIAESLAKMHPLQRLGEADDLAQMAAFLLGEESRWITGQVIGVDGGRSNLA